MKISTLERLLEQCEPKQQQTQVDDSLFIAQ
jgi:hypothetical protein